MFAYTQPAWFDSDTTEARTYHHAWGRRQLDSKQCAKVRKAIDKGLKTIEAEKSYSLKRLCTKLQHEATVEAHQARRYWFGLPHGIPEGTKIDGNALLVPAPYTVKAVQVVEDPENYYRYVDRAQRTYKLSVRVPIPVWWSWSLGRLHIDATEDK